MSRTSSKYLQFTAYVLLTAIFIIGIGVARDCSRLPKTPVEGYSSGDTLDIAILYGPGSYYVYGDTLSGINITLAELFQKDTGRPVKVWPVTDAAEALTKLDEGAFDVLASLPLDNYIRNRFPVSESIFLDRLVLIELADSVSGDKIVSSSLDLIDKEIHVASGSSAINRLSNLSEEIGGKIKIIEEPDLSDELLCIKVASGDIPLAVVNERIAKNISGKYPLLKYDSSVSFTQFQVWVFNPEDSLARKDFNIWYDSFNDTPKYREIISKY